MTELQAHCRRFMTGADAQHHANQNNQMMKASIWKTLTLCAQKSLTQYEPEYTLNGTICGLPILKNIV